MGRVWVSKYGVPACTFNMRGVGKSTGHSTLCGHAEVRHPLGWTAGAFSSDAMLPASTSLTPVAGRASEDPAYHQTCFLLPVRLMF